MYSWLGACIKRQPRPSTKNRLTGCEERKDIAVTLKKIFNRQEGMKSIGANAFEAVDKQAQEYVIFFWIRRLYEEAASHRQGHQPQACPLGTPQSIPYT
jgi:hypothetical protein